MKSFEWVFAANARSSDHRRRTDYRPSTALVHDVIHSMPNNFFLPFELRNSPEVLGKGYYDVTFNSELRTRSV